ncbi:restriction endonuclease subunit S [Tepidicella baoligensis]|uniref:restriction endonuclease subunit S n=1 Tax=Tepidicella baoligensis TaxID=2707016 RepID=UPI0015D9CA00|nr:restriction endonuclease subunit S [Tepidicella baoligensis]
MVGEWTISDLGELTTNFDGRRKPVKESDRRTGPYPYYGASGVVDHVDGYLFDGEYLLIAEDGENLRTRQTPIAFMAKGKFWVNNHAHVVTGNDKADTRFLMYALQNTDISGYLTGAVMPKLTQGNLNRIELLHPCLPEQRAIAHILGTLDDKIELNRRRNQTLEAMARALFKDWFVDFGPVRAKMEGQEPYLPADLWQLFPDRLDDEGKPEGWSERPLDEIADFLNGLALQKFPATDPDDSLPVIKIAELRNGVSAKSDRASREVPAKYIIKDGDFLFSWSGSLLAKFWTEGEGALNQHLFKVTSEHYPMWFVSHWVHHHLEEFQAIAASKATTMGHIQRGHLKAAMTICPPDDVVGRMGIVMAPLVEQTIQNELESRNLAQLRDTLLPKLISGELRIAEAEKYMERAEAQAVSQLERLS